MPFWDPLWIPFCPYGCLFGIPVHPFLFLWIPFLGPSKPFWPPQAWQDTQLISFVEDCASLGTLEVPGALGVWVVLGLWAGLRCWVWLGVIGPQG